METALQDAGRGPWPAERASILFVDAYDSFTNNIISLLTTTLHCSVRVVRIDSPLFPTQADLVQELRKYDAVVLGPGPGNPKNDADVGLMNRIWTVSGDGESDEHVDIPILGICLGFQSLSLQCGEAVRRLKGGGVHGLVRRITHCGQGIYEGVSEVDATLYQSLCIDVGQEDISDELWDNGARWTVVSDRKEADSSRLLQPLAWVERLGSTDKRIMMAARHVSRPWWGVQYHPESICTNQESQKVILNWMKAANTHNRTTRREVMRDAQKKAGVPVRRSLLSQLEKTQELKGSTVSTEILDEDVDSVYVSKVMDLPENLSVTDIAAVVQNGERDIIVLESTNHKANGMGANANTGRYSIIALNIDKTVRVEYSVGTSHVTMRPPNKRAHAFQVSLKNFGGIWPFLANYLDKRRITDGNPDIPFWGGFMGYITYELGLEGIDVAPKPNTGQRRGVVRPDLNFSWVTRSIVIDHHAKKAHLQQIIPARMRDSAGAAPWWLDGRGAQLVKTLGDAFYIRPNLVVPEAYTPSVVNTHVRAPKQQEYEAAVRACQSDISAGESYEMCLTSLTTLRIPTPAPFAFGSRRLSEGPTLVTSAWSIYTSLRDAQPAPFASFMRLGPATLISCSPERFMTWAPSGRCELRPMKGTVKKADAPSRAEAEALLAAEKETAENLMIVDLVRHDLYGVCGPGNVRVERLMGVEEYESVWQMVSVVVGDIPVSEAEVAMGEAAKARELPARVEGRVPEEEMGYSGVDVLAASLPPGSMTGAPKKRSCELLSEVEQQRRGLYSGVMGYMDVGGRGDWSVNIRCAFRWDDEGAVSDHDTWHVGAGGAVTALSDPAAERKEMETKLFNTLNGFGLGLDLGK